MHSSFAAYYCTSETSAVCPLLALAPALPIPRGFSHSFRGVSGYVASLVRVSAAVSAAHDAFFTPFAFIYYIYVMNIYLDSWPK